MGTIALDVFYHHRSNRSQVKQSKPSEPISSPSAARLQKNARKAAAIATNGGDQENRRWDTKHPREFVFLSNHFDLDAVSVAALYCQSWQIELLFKALKQNLKIKTFVGTSANALKIQIWTARIALLLVRYLQLRSRLQWHLSRFVALLRHQLFAYRDLGRFPDNPIEGPPPLRKDYIDPQPSLFS
ncbi:MAG: transposase [Acidobacteriaceae bacterium]|jgi:hypothetical protein|nr:transposase [Acidobacteriaceae bacterium]